MDAHSFMPQVEVLSVADSGRRRRWSAAEKIRIVEESLSRPRSGAATARRYDISRTLLTRWRKEYRAGLLGQEPSVAFARVMIAAAPPRVEAPGSPEPETACAETLAITLVNGRQVADRRRRDRHGRAGAAASGSGSGMIAFPQGAKVWLAGGATDMRKGMNGLALLVQQARLGELGLRHRDLRRNRRRDQAGLDRGDLIYCRSMPEARLALAWSEVVSAPDGSKALRTRPAP
ncbi:MAG: transposase [Amaricoccus sp.]